MKKDTAISADVERFYPTAESGLSESQARSRKEAGLINRVTKTPTRTVGQILRANLFTLFNLINLLLAIALWSVGSYRNTLFMGVIVLNTLIGVYQETKSKKAVEKLSLIAQPTATVVRDGRESTVPTTDVLLDDVISFSPGMQISADCEVLSGAIEANESLLTGESDPVVKGVGDSLKSGSFVISGVCRAKAVGVGDESYAAKLAAKARAFKKPTSEIMTALNRIVKGIGIAIVPVGLMLYFRQLGAGSTVTDAVTGSAAAMIGMIPQGLVLLTSVALAAGAYNLAKRSVLISELYAIETLARVDVLCLDKTGTITTGEIALDRLIELDSEKGDLENAVRAIVKSTKGDNATSRAFREALGGDCAEEIVSSVPFSSDRKWSACLTKGGYAIYAGAPERLLPISCKALVDKYASEGLRVVAIARGRADEISDRPDPESLESMGLALMTDKIRPNARQTLEYFDGQGVGIKIISGDNPITVAAIASRAGVKGADKYVDMSTLADDAAVGEAAKKYTVFSRVTPKQKMLLVKALKDQGHVVGMTGDGVNDVLALKQADCSIAMASGSDAAKQVSTVTLLDDDFGNMPYVVFEGRRVTNNVQNAASLFLTKTIFSMALALITLIAGEKYPFEPIQLTLFSSIFIGYPSFVLALQPNKRRIEGDFLKTVLAHALPSGLAIAVGIFIIVAVTSKLGLSHETVGTMALGCTSAIGLVALIGVCVPFNWLRAALVASCVAGFSLCVIFLQGLFGLTALASGEMLITAGCAALGTVIMLACAGWVRKSRGHVTGR